MKSKKKLLPGYGLAIIDETEDYGDDRFDTPQVGKLITVLPTEMDKEKFDYFSLVGKTIYWKKYADADATFADAGFEGKDVVFIQLDKIVGYE